VCRVRFIESLQGPAGAGRDSHSGWISFRGAGHHHGAILGATAILNLVACTTPPAQDLPTTGRVESRLGTIELENGYPTAATVDKIFDDIDYQRACQAYLWALPLMAMQQWQNEHLVKFGAGRCDYVDYLTFQDKLGLLTANATTPYVMACSRCPLAPPPVASWTSGSGPSPTRARLGRTRVRAASI
jgi:hypothetical protein